MIAYLHKKHGLIFLASALIAFAAPCAAHQDTILSVVPGGNLTGLPPEYLPASARIEYSDDKSSIRTARLLSISIGNSTKTLPACLLESLKIGQDKELRFLASWYHELSELPAYLVIEFREADHEIGFAGHSVLLELDSLELLMILEHKKHDSYRTNDQVELSSFCPTQMQSDDAVDSDH